MFNYTQTDGQPFQSSVPPKTKATDATYLDFNGDGYVDVYDNNRIAYGKGDGQFGNWVSTGTNVKNNEIKFADIDGDGDVDLITEYHQLSGHYYLTLVKVTTDVSHINVVG